MDEKLAAALTEREALTMQELAKHEENVQAELRRFRREMNHIDEVFHLRVGDIKEPRYTVHPFSQLEDRFGVYDEKRKQWLQIGAQFDMDKTDAETLASHYNAMIAAGQ